MISKVSSIQYRIQRNRTPHEIEVYDICIQIGQHGWSMTPCISLAHHFNDSLIDILLPTNPRDHTEGCAIIQDTLHQITYLDIESDVGYEAFQESRRAIIPGIQHQEQHGDITKIWAHFSSVFLSRYDARNEERGNHGTYLLYLNYTTPL